MDAVQTHARRPPPQVPGHPPTLEQRVSGFTGPIYQDLGGKDDLSTLEQRTVELAGQSLLLARSRFEAALGGDRAAQEAWRVGALVFSVLSKRLGLSRRAKQVMTPTAPTWQTAIAAEMAAARGGTQPAIATDVPLAAAGDDGCRTCATPLVVAAGDPANV